MKKTATLLALAGLSMAASPEHFHGSFRTRKVVDHQPLVDPYVTSKPSSQPETMNADDELLMIYKPRYDIDPGMVIRPSRGADIDPGMVIRPPYGDIDRGIFVKPRPPNQLLYADDELASYSDFVKHPNRAYVDYRPLVKPQPAVVADDELALHNKEVNKGFDAEMLIKPKPRRGDAKLKPTVTADDDELVFIRRPLDSSFIKQAVFVDDEFMLANKEVNKGLDAGMVIKPRRGDVDPKMIIKPKRGDIDPKIIINPKKDVIYADDELMFANSLYRPYVKPTIIADDEFVYLGKSLIKPAVFVDDEFMLAGKEVNKGIDAGMVIKPRRGDVDPKMVIKPKRGDIDPKIIINPKKDVIYADDELVYVSKLLTELVDNELVR
jgi:hypothetical protein